MHYPKSDLAQIPFPNCYSNLDLWNRNQDQRALGQAKDLRLWIEDR